MKTCGTPREIALSLLSRSPCQTQVAAVLSDKKGHFAWGWNHPGYDGYGEHAEHHAIKRGNPQRLMGARITIASRRRSSGNLLLSRPCECHRHRGKEGSCLTLLRRVGIATVEYVTPSGTWKVESL